MKTIAGCVCAVSASVTVVIHAVAANLCKTRARRLIVKGAYNDKVIGEIGIG